VLDKLHLLTERFPEIERAFGSHARVA